jgi:hypothetical protein
MQFLAYLAVLVIGSLIAVALAPKPPKQKAPTLEDFDLPTAEEGRAIPWIFGTYKITDPNFIWYGDLEVRTKTKDKVKTRLYRMGTQQEFCISPVDALVALEYGGKDCGITEVTSSQQISINLPNLFGGRDKEGGIDGDFDVCFGEPTQAVNDYLLAQIGAPLSAFRDSLTLVGRKPSWVANSTYIKPLLPTVRCIEAGWEDGTCWYPETAGIPDDSISSTMAFDEWIDVSIEKDGLWLRIYINGQFSNEVELPYNPTGPVDPAGWMIGRYTYSGGDTPAFFYGLIDRFVVTRAAKYGGTSFTPSTDTPGPSDPFWDDVVIALDLSGSEGSTTITDIKGLSTWTAWGGAHITTSDGVTGGSCLSLDGAGDYLSCPINAYNSITSDWTVDVCVKMPVGAVPTGEIWTYGQVEAASHGHGLAGNVSAGEIWMRGFVGANPPSLLPIGIVDSIETAPPVWDMNPAHIIYKCLTSTDQGAGEPSATIDDANFRAAALTFYTERLGLSLQWRNEGSIRDFLAEVCTHAGAVLTLDPSTGLTQIIPLRDDYAVDELDLYTEDHILEVVEWQDAADGEAVNEVTVEYRKRDGSKGTATWVNRASVQEQGVSHATLSFPGITTHALARRIAKRECLQRSSNLSRGKLKVNRNTWDKLPGRVFRFSHGPEAIAETVVRVIDIDLGTLTDGEITITVVQDTFSLDDAITDVGDPGGGWTAPDTDPAAISTQDIIEAPFWTLVGDLGAANAAALGVDAGYLISLAVKSSAVAEGYNRWTRISPDDYAETGEAIDFAPSATLTASLDRSTYIGIALSGGTNLDLVEAGWIAMIGTGTAAEFCYVLSVDAVTNETIIYRGRFDTTPQEHAAGTRVWFLDGDAPDWPRDPTQWADGDAVNVKLQPITGGGVLALASASAMTGTLDSRQVRPYPPGNVEINGDGHPTILAGALAVTWAHRDRLVQGYSHIDQYDPTDYGPEAGTTYNAYAYDDADDTLLDSDTGISGATWTPTITTSCTARIEIESVRDGYVSWQRQVRAFLYFTTSGLLTEAGDYLLAEAGDYLITET